MIAYLSLIFLEYKHNDRKYKFVQEVSRISQEQKRVGDGGKQKVTEEVNESRPQANIKLSLEKSNYIPSAGRRERSEKKEIYFHTHKHKHTQTNKHGVDEIYNSW